MTICQTYRFRLRDKHSRELNRQARAVNFVFNYCNETQIKAVKSARRWLSGVDLQRLTAGSSELLDLHAHTIQKVCQQYDRSRRQKNRPWLRFRGRKSLAWVPFNKGHVRFDRGCFVFRGRRYAPMHYRELPKGAVFLAGTFSADSRGRWYINVPVQLPENSYPTCRAGQIGIDLGIKHLAALSSGEKIENPRHLSRMQYRLSRAQRARKKRQTVNILAAIKNARRDHLHKISADIAANHDIIVVGNVSSKKLARTNMAKSVLDAGWSTLRTQLSYKAMRHSGRMIEVNERLTSQSCSVCGELPEGRPRGIAGLRIREWQCSECGEVHDRDINAARNILRIGLDTLEEGAAL